jgi:hypothetical protein
LFPTFQFGKSSEGGRSQGETNDFEEGKFVRWSGSGETEEAKHFFLCPGSGYWVKDFEEMQHINEADTGIA